MTRTALVLSAGGMFGAYQAGAWEALAPVVQPDVVVGASIGSLNGWAIAGGCNPTKLSERWLGLHQAASHHWHFPRSPLDGALDSARLHNWIRDLYESYTPVVPYGVVLTDLIKLKPRLFVTPDVGWEHLAASCAILGVLPQIRIHGRVYTDGGLIQALPVWAACEMGAQRIIAINALPRMPGSTFQSVVRLFRKVAPKPPLVRVDAELTIIEPTSALGSVRESIYWSEANTRVWIEAGRRDALRAISTLQL